MGSPTKAEIKEKKKKLEEEVKKLKRRVKKKTIYTWDYDCDVDPKTWRCKRCGADHPGLGYRCKKPIKVAVN